MSDNQKLSLDEPLTNDDCKFLKSIFVVSYAGQKTLDLTCLTKEQIQGYGIAFKVLDGKLERACPVLTSLFLFLVILYFQHIK